MGEVPTLLILSDKGPLTDNLVFQLNLKKCKALTSRALTYKDLEKDLGQKNLSEINFVICISSATFFLNPSNTQLRSDLRKTTLAHEIVLRFKTKGVFVYSFIQKKELQERTRANTTSLLGELKTSTSVIYVGDIVENFNDGILGNVLEKIIKTKKVNLPQSFSFYPISGAEASALIIKTLFSFKAYNERIAILGPELRVDKIKKFLFKDDYVRSDFFTQNENLAKADVDEVIYSTQKQHISGFVKPLAKKILSPKPKTKKKLFSIIFTLLAIPFLSFFAGMILANLGATAFINGQVTGSEYLARTSHRLLSIPHSLNYFVPFFRKSESHIKESEVLIKLTAAARESYNLYESFLDSDNNLSGNYQAITLNLQSAYNNLGFLQNGSSSSKLLVFKKYIYDLIVLSRELPDIFGAFNNKKYLVIFENPKLLMPGGGKIEKIYLVNFHKGEITETSLLDPKDGKNNIAGLVNTPKIYPEFLKADWYLGNANISSDFRSSAEQIVFFLEKQQDIQVDGVISLNTSLFSDQKVPRSKKDFYAKLYSVFLDLEKNNIQIFLKKSSQEKALTNLGWGGSIKKPECINSCYKDIINYFELSLDDQSAVRREMHLQINLEEKVIKRKTTLYLENTGNSEYRAYLNFLVPENSGFSPVTLFNETPNMQKEVDITSFDEFKILSFFVKIEPFKSKTAVVSWEGETSADQKKLEEYDLLIGRQGGMTNYKIDVNINFGGKEVYLQGPNFTLTDMGGLMYNADLSQDKILRVYFK